MSGRDYKYEYHEPPEMRREGMERRAEGLEERGEGRAADLRARLEAEGFDEDTIQQMLAQYGALTEREMARGEARADLIHYEHGQPVFEEREDPWRGLARNLVGLSGQVGAQYIGMQLGQRSMNTPQPSATGQVGQRFPGITGRYTPGG